MTAREIAVSALAILAEPESSLQDFSDTIIPVMNIMLPEMWEINDGLRRARGKAPEPLPKISALEDDVPYEEELCRSCMPYGLASKMIFDDDDMAKVQYLQSMYVSAMGEFAKAMPCDVEDVY